MSICIGVFGVPGVGKSTLLDAHVVGQPLDHHVGGSSVVKAIIKPASVRDFDSWPADRQDAVRSESIRRLVSLRDAAPRCLLVAGHFTLRNRVTGVIERILTQADHSFFDALVLVDSSVEQVLAQTASDDRARHGQDAERVAEHLVFERVVAAETAALMGVPLHCMEAATLELRLDGVEAFIGHVQQACS
jgi:adenylate kinase